MRIQIKEMDEKCSHQLCTWKEKIGKTKKRMEEKIWAKKILIHLISFFLRRNKRKIMRGSRRRERKGGKIGKENTYTPYYFF